jgi:hypothetical protein
VLGVHVGRKMEKSVAELLDGYSIAKLKAERIGDNGSIIKFEKYKTAMEELRVEYPGQNWDIIIKSFVDVNSTIWKYEALVRKGQLDDDPLAIYSRTILVREFNQLRTDMANMVCVFLSETDELNIKKDHVSE